MTPRALILLLLAGCPDIHASRCLRACRAHQDSCFASASACFGDCSSLGGAGAEEDCEQDCTAYGRACLSDALECIAACAEQVEGEL